MLMFFLGLVNSVVVVVIHSIFALIKYLTPMALWPKKNLEGEVALVTGAGSGIGREVALSLARHGCKLVLWDINTKWNNETSQMIREIGVESTAYTCDVTDKDSVYLLARKVEENVGKVTILVNNAGIVSGKRLLDLPDESIIDTFNVNTLSHFWTLKAFLPSMIEVNRGHIVTVSSLLSEIGLPWCSDYCASKAAVKSMHQSVAREMIQRGCSDIHFTLVCPYLVTSGLFKGISVRYEWLIRPLTPEYVGRKIVEAVQTEQDYLYLPYILQLLSQVQRVLPFRAQLVLEDFMGASVAMATFTGRDKED